MPKKSSKRSKSPSSSPNYQHFKLHGNHPMQKVVVLAVVVLAIALVVGYLFQPNIVSFFGIPAGY